MKSNKKGLTLVEVITTLALASIIILAVMLGIQAFTRNFVNVKKRLDAKTAATLVLENIQNAARYSKKALIVQGDNALGYNMIKSRGGRLYQTLLYQAEQPFMTEESYYGFNCNVTFDKFDDNTVTIEIVIYDTAATASALDAVPKPLYTLSRNLRLLNTKDSARNFGLESDMVVKAGGSTKSDALRYLL